METRAVGLELTGCMEKFGNFALKDKRVFSAEAIFNCTLCTRPRVNKNTAINSTPQNSRHNSPLCSFCLVMTVETLRVKTSESVTVHQVSHSPFERGALGVSRDARIIR